MVIRMKYNPQIFSRLKTHNANKQNLPQNHGRKVIIAAILLIILSYMRHFVLK